MSSKATIAEHAGQFAAVMHAILQNERTKAELAEQPLATLKKYGIEFKDSAVSKKVAGELTAIGSAGIAGMPPDDGTYWPPTTIAQFLSVTIVAIPGEVDDPITVDRPRVDAFVDKASLEYTIGTLKQRVATLENTLLAH